MCLLSPGGSSRAHHRRLRVTPASGARWPQLWEDRASNAAGSRELLLLGQTPSPKRPRLGLGQPGSGHGARSSCRPCWGQVGFFLPNTNRDETAAAFRKQTQFPRRGNLRRGRQWGDQVRRPRVIPEGINLELRSWLPGLPADR